MAWFSLQSVSGDTWKLRDTRRLCSRTKERENSRRWSWSRGIYRSCVSSRPILWVFLARVWKVEGKEERRERGRRRREAKEGVLRVWWVSACELCVSKVSGQRARPYEHNSARYTRTDLSRLGPTSREPYGPPYGLMGRVSYARRPSVPILCPIRLIPSKVPRLRIRPPLRRELIAKFYVNYVTFAHYTARQFLCRENCVSETLVIIYDGY